MEPTGVLLTSIWANCSDILSFYHIVRASDRVRKKKEIMRPVSVSLCGKKGLLCDKLCDSILANLILFY